MDFFTIPILVIFVLLFLSAFFSGSETGLTAASRAKIYRLKQDGNNRADMVERLRGDKDGLIGTILLGNNVVNILASALATSVAIQYFGDEGVLYATIAMTMLILVFAEMFPKTYAFYNAEKVALAVSPTFMILVKIFSPFTSAVQYMIDLFMRLLGLNKKSNQDLVSGAEELRGAIDLQHKEGMVEKANRDMLESILDLEKTEVEEIMTHRKNIEGVDADMAPYEIVSQVLDSVYTRVPLWRGTKDNIVGVLHVKHLLKILRKHGEDIDELNVMGIAKEPWFIPEATKLSKQLVGFREKKNHLAFVVDEYGDLVGLVTLEDILEEIVGAIYKKKSVDLEGIRKIKGGKYIIGGEATIRDINRELDWELPDDGALTIAGLIINRVENIPEVGQEFIIYGRKFKVLKKKRNQITEVRVNIV